jgi:hypothetical protein
MACDERQHVEAKFNAPAIITLKLLTLITVGRVNQGDSTRGTIDSTSSEPISVCT